MDIKNTENKKYYVCISDVGITKFDSENGSIVSISANIDKKQWIQFDHEKAIIVRAHIGWDIKEVKL